ncbi:hypothetical protein ACA910_019570 [Epithemia clementina (nom. ined.)]
MKVISIWIETTQAGKRNLLVSPAAYVHEVKSMLSNEWKLSTDQMDLFHKGKFLKESARLANLDIEDNDTLFLSISARSSKATKELGDEVLTAFQTSMVLRICL